MLYSDKCIALTKKIMEKINAENVEEILPFGSLSSKSKHHPIDQKKCPEKKEKEEDYEYIEARKGEETVKKYIYMSFDFYHSSNFWVVENGIQFGMVLEEFLCLGQNL